MKLLVVSSAPFVYENHQIFAYGPYVNEMAVWKRYADEMAFCCPVWKTANGLLVAKIDFEITKHFRLIDFNLNSFPAFMKAFICSFFNFYVIMKAMFWADHIHLRCPGNIGLLGCIAQMAFPGKVKTAKYAGNWDPKAKQPLSYRLQRSILSNTFLTRKMQVLVYGKWNGMTKNIQPFFTATYHESDKMPVQDKKLAGRINFIFAGTLVAGKNPLYAVQLAEILLHKGHNVALDLYGEGPEKAIVLAYIKEKQLENNIYLKNNQTQEILKEAFQECHFVILPSASEGWPKVIAEGMFWGAVPLASAVSCVPYMLDYGKRGILLTMDLEKDILQVEQLLQNENDFQLKRTSASKWSRAYTLDVFETRIKQLLQR